MDKMADQRSARAEVHAAREGAAACEQADESGCFGTPPATDFHAEDGEMAVPGGNELRVHAPWFDGQPGELPQQYGRAGGAEHHRR